MQKYRETQHRSPWYRIIHEVPDTDYFNDSTNVKRVATAFLDQMKLELELLAKGEDVSDCAINVPRLGSLTNRQTNIAYTIAYMNIGLSDDDFKNINNRKKSYTKYSQMVSKLTTKFKEQLQKKEDEIKEFKDARIIGKRGNFCLLKHRPISDQIAHPVEMPVEVATLESLQPFFDYLKQNKKVEGTDMVKFTRGVHYDDQRIDLCKQVVGPNWIGNLVDSIKLNPYVDHFLLGNNIIGPTGGQQIGQFISNPHVPTIKTWYLAGNRLDAEGIKPICDALKTDTHCISLWLKRNPILKGIKHIAEMLEVNKTIKILDLHNTGVFDEGIEYLFNSLRHNTSLKYLYLEANGIVNPKPICDYFDYLVANNLKGLTSLWCGINRLDDDGVIMLANSLKHYTHIKRICLGANRMSAVSCKILLESLQNHPNLVMLDIGLYKSTGDLSELPNNIGDAGVPDICSFIEENKSIKVLSIIHNNISIEGLNQILESYEKNTTLLYIYYDQYGIDISDAFKDRMHAIMSRNIQRAYPGMSYHDFNMNKLRFIRHGKHIKYIDSVYRNKNGSNNIN